MLWFQIPFIRIYRTLMTFLLSRIVAGCQTNTGGQGDTTIKSMYKRRCVYLPEIRYARRATRVFGRSGEADVRAGANWSGNWNLWWYSVGIGADCSVNWTLTCSSPRNNANIAFPDFNWDLSLPYKMDRGCIIQMCFDARRWIDLLSRSLRACVWFIFWRVYYGSFR